MSAEGHIAPGGVGEPSVEGPLSERLSEQYSLAKILGIWALAAVPMGILSWIAFPLLAPAIIASDAPARTGDAEWTSKATAKQLTRTTHERTTRGDENRAYRNAGLRCRMA